MSAKLWARRLKRWSRPLSDPRMRAYWQLRWRLDRLPRFRKTRVRALGMDLELVDKSSFLASFREIFVDEIYRFESARPNPFIIDCGANIGLSVLYFKKLFPDSRIEAYEPDPAIFSVLRGNLQRNGAGDVRIVQRAVWNENTRLSFYVEGADAGRVQSGAPGETIFVETVRLKDRLAEKVDFLKLDVEGAEGEIIPDVKSELSRVEHLFVEYHSFADGDQRLSTLLRCLEDAGFRLYLQPVVSVRQPLFNPPAPMGMDLQMNIFGRQVQRRLPACG